jgi:hypothetical protein
MKRGDMLEREAGPSGWAQIGGERIRIDGWELFEGDDTSPHMCRGWFRYRADRFPAKPGMTVELELTTDDGEHRPLTAELVKARTTAPEWEFRAER